MRLPVGNIDKCWTGGSSRLTVRSDPNATNGKRLSNTQMDDTANRMQWRLWLLDRCKRFALRQRLAARAAEQWPQLADITVRYHGECAYYPG